MEHIIKFETKSWETTIKKVSEYMKEGYCLYNIQTTIETLYCDCDEIERVCNYYIEMIKHEKENNNA